MRTPSTSPHFAGAAVGPSPERGRRGIGRAGAHAPPAPASKADRWTRFALYAFMSSLIVPAVLDIGSMRLSFYRVALIALSLPAIALYVSDKRIRVKPTDVFVLLFVAWSSVSIAVVDGYSSSLQSAGILALETLGPYLLARSLIRSEKDLRTALGVLFAVLCFLAPFAAYETVTGAKPLISLSGLVFPTIDITLMTPRLGFWRVQGPFEHSILFGVFCGSALASTHLILGGEAKIARRWLMSALVIAMTAISLSSAVIAAALAQVMLLGWNFVLRSNPFRWKILMACLVLVYLFISVASNQSFMSFYISYFSFDRQTADFRLIIWRYGSASALNHPWFGTGFDEWDRPAWMPPSIDMFWLINAVRYGIPAAVLMLLAFASAVLGVGLKRNLDDRLSRCRLAYVITMTFFFMVGWTVHFWNATYVLFVFLMGSGLWLLEAEAETAPAEKAGSGSPPDRRLERRFPQGASPPARSRAGAPRARDASSSA